LRVVDKWFPELTIKCFLLQFLMQFINVSGGLVGGSNPPAFQRAEKERMEKAAREENEGGISSLNHDEQLYSDYCSMSKRGKQCSGECNCFLSD
jgi:hypothetical protein